MLERISLTALGEMTDEELEKSDAEKKERAKEFFNSDTWKWVHNEKLKTLELVDEDGIWKYEVDLERCGSAEAVLDWICQISHKMWATEKVLAELVWGLDKILNCQGNLCGMGMLRKAK